MNWWNFLSLFFRQRGLLLPCWLIFSSDSSSFSDEGLLYIGSSSHNFRFLLSPLHYWLRRSMEFEKYKKWAKVETCFSLIKPTKQDFLHFSRWSWPKFWPEIFLPFFLKISLAKIMVNVQERVNGGSVKNDFWYTEYIDHAEKKSSK